MTNHYWASLQIRSILRPNMHPPIDPPPMLRSLVLPLPKNSILKGDSRVKVKQRSALGLSIFFFEISGKFLRVEGSPAHGSMGTVDLPIEVGR
ncbi:hypothetical protein SAY86_007194 [Trapa natans]|uniref:Uncharacterized protein n=1 Tax=Trapa natans TaxID=22666 RepID=A0AAN7LD29_TRANT|nr:hypothetical protein SAY86_007194 [Trapa natans]